MKSIVVVALSATAFFATASADMLQINNPTDGTVWKTEVSNFVGWTGNCASMGNDAKTVKVDLVNGPSNAVRYVATLGTLDCSGSNTRADMTVPGTVASGQYSIVVRTAPEQSYTNSFQIDNPAQPAAPSSPSTPPQATTAASPANPTSNSAADMATKTTVSVKDAKILDMVFNPEGTMLPDKETESMLNTEPTVIEPEMLKNLKALEAEAVMLAERDDINGAIAKFTEAITLCPTYASAYNNRAQAYRIQENTKAALEDLDKAIEHGNGQPSILKQAYTQRGVIKKLAGDKNGAQLDFERGARYGNPIAKAVSVQDNPISQLCGAMVMEMLSKELNGSKETANSN
ncbi:Tetratricopeptide repeat protein 36 [Dissophora globulifera]|nr:Tetratricopeptide repeat protein 36 [Dissophora globulifera]